MNKIEGNKRLTGLRARNKFMVTCASLPVGNFCKFVQPRSVEEEENSYESVKTLGMSTRGVGRA
jgi:hypothetical protein